MASPQLENGFARIANELLEQFLVRDFSKRELVVLLYVVRNTYGFSRKAFALDPREAAAATGLDAENLRKSIKALLASGVLATTEEGIGLQKDHERWQVDARASVKTTDNTAGQNNREFRSKQPRIPVKTTDSVGPIAPFQAVFQEPKERKKKETPLAPVGGEVERVPFTDDLPSQADADRDPVLEEENPPVQFARRGPDFTKPVTAAPKPTPLTVKGLLEACPRFARFRAEWPKSERRNDRPADLVTYWVKFEVAESPRFEQTMEALDRKKKSRGWLRTDEDIIPSPAAWVNGKPWEAIEAEGWEPATEAANPYQHKPWGPIWTQMGETPTYYGVMNFCAAVAPAVNPKEAGEVFKTAGFEAAVEYVIERRNAG